jgi:hypothetical protein
MNRLVCGVGNATPLARAIGYRCSVMQHAVKGLEDWILLLRFRGPGPFRLPNPKHATAEKTSPNAVTLKLHVDGESGDPPKLILADLTAEEARTLAIRLWLAADKSL